MHEYERQLDEISVDWHARGLIDSAYADLPFSERFGHVLNDAGPYGYRPFDITLSGPITEDSPMHTGPAVFNLITHPRLLDVVEQLIGPEILSTPFSTCASSHRSTCSTRSFRARTRCSAPPTGTGPGRRDGPRRTTRRC